MIKNNKTQLRVPYAFTVFGEEERKAVAEVLKSPQIVAGKRAEEFETKIAGLFGKKFGLLVNSGSSANLLAFEVLNLPAGSEVITPVLTFATTVAPIIKKGLVPAFVDVELGKYTLDIDQVEKMINSKTRALMVPSLFGNVPDLPRLQRLAKKHNLFLVEDSCDTLGATINGKPTGVYSDISTTSFYASHIVTAAGEGGMICLNNPEWYRRVRVLSGWGRRSALNESEDIAVRFQTKLDGQPYDSKFIFEEIGYNFRTTDIAAAFALAQLKKLDKFSEIRIKNFQELLDFFRNYQNFFILPEQLKTVRTNWLSFPLLIKDRAPFSRMEIVTHLEKNNIQTRPMFTGNILKQPGFLNIKKRTRKGGYPNADLIMKNSFVIGCHHGLEKRHLDYLKKIFSDFLGRF
ncbi:MAG: aminotransferase class I/II-fold pyridoxal phosphate-dependent enzyme [Patescibacteria group bacterium]